MRRRAREQATRVVFFSRLTKDSQSLPTPARRAAALALSPESRAAGISDTRTIDKTHLTATAPNGQTVAVVTFSDGRCGIAESGRPIPGMQWDVEQMPECTATFARLASLE